LSPEPPTFTTRATPVNTVGMFRSHSHLYTLSRRDVSFECHPNALELYLTNYYLCKEGGTEIVSQSVNL